MVDAVRHGIGVGMRLCLLADIRPREHGRQHFWTSESGRTGVEIHGRSRF
jgi:hypothetical protein